MPRKDNGRSAQTEVDFTITEPQPDPSDERRARLKIHQRGVEWEGHDLPATAVTGVVGLFLMTMMAVGTVAASQVMTDGPIVLLGGGILTVLIGVFTVILAIAQRDGRPPRTARRQRQRVTGRSHRGNHKRVTTKRTSRRRR
ncbi:hypothetical protein [Micromonospora chalcea]|uniref:hypothetical protein n=1 Tax=Micromonospora chalcea TaxID=1874 RepID=UPI0038281E81